MKHLVSPLLRQLRHIVVWKNILPEVTLYVKNKTDSITPETVDYTIHNKAGITLNFLSLLKADISANRNNLKGQIAMILFRLAHAAQHNKVSNPSLRLLIVSLYRGVVECGFGIELRAGAQVGPGLRIEHGVGIVVNDDAIIGKDVLIRQGVTIGVRGKESCGCPTIGDRVEIGAGAVIVGPICVGDDVSIGANVVLSDNIKSGEVVRAPTPTITSRRK